MCARPKGWVSSSVVLGQGIGRKGILFIFILATSRSLHDLSSPTRD